MRRPPTRLQVSTFPFLAVMLSTMGALILVLLIMDRKSKLAVRYKAEQAAVKAARQVSDATQAAAQALARQREEWEQRKLQARIAWELSRQELHERLLG